MRSRVAENIQSAREGKDLTREQLAQRLNTTRVRVWRVETGKIGLDVSELPRWAEALGVTAAELLA
ncbi:MAG TPA: helix-turn-helix transcriptional regulator [Kofleriaceae bacterium]|nr:helix-turn-helix transcriptional regulator [Kofleriaceae bacterium]